MAKRRLWKPSSFKPLKVDGKRDSRERYIVTRGKDAGAIISKAERIKRVFGLHPTKLAAERKAGHRSCKSAASEAQAKKQIEFRQKRKGQFAEPHITGPQSTPSFTKTDGQIASDFFGKNL
jgi:hypothetical protein